MPTLKVGGGRCTGRRRTRGRWRRRGRGRDPMGRREGGRLRSTKTMGTGRGRLGVRESVASLDGRRRGGRRGGAESGRRSRGGGGGAKTSVAVGGGKTAKGAAGTSTKTGVRGCGGRAGEGCGWIGEGGGRCRLGGGRGRASRGGTSRGGGGFESVLGSLCSFGFGLGATLSLVDEGTHMSELLSEPPCFGVSLTRKCRGAGGGGDGTTLCRDGPALGLSKSSRQVGSVGFESGMRSTQLGEVRRVHACGTLRGVEGAL